MKTESELVHPFSRYFMHKHSKQTDEAISMGTTGLHTCLTLPISISLLIPKLSTLTLWCQNSLH